jgi:hypothetical protein
MMRFYPHARWLDRRGLHWFDHVCLSDAVTDDLLIQVTDWCHRSIGPIRERWALVERQQRGHYCKFLVFLHTEDFIMFRFAWDEFTDQHDHSWG